MCLFFRRQIWNITPDLYAKIGAHSGNGGWKWGSGFTFSHFEPKCENVKPDPSGSSPLPFCAKTLYTPRPRMILLKTTQNRAFYLIVLQSGVVLAIVVALLFCGYTKSAVSACAGGVIAVLTNACFAFLFLSRSYLPTAHQVLARLYFAEIVKWILTISLFYLMIIKMEVATLPFFLSYAVAQWIGLLGFLL